MRAFLLVAVLLAAPAASAQDADADVRATVEAFFDGVRSRDSTAMRATLHSSARFVYVASQAGEPDVQVAPVVAFLASMADSPVAVDFVLEDDYPVHVDRRLATVWAPYEIYVNMQRVRCGVNTFALAHDDTAWRIVSAITTRRADCGAE